MRMLTMLLAAGLCLPARGDDLLLRIRAKMSDVLLRQPNYTCTETIERTRQIAANHSRIEDTLRLEVALVDGKEMFAWPGSKQFDDRDLSELVSTGMFGNGNFAIYARIVFLTNVATFEDRGETELAGRRVLHYDFRVSRSADAYRLRVNHRESTVGFHGSFYADPVTLEARRIEVVAEDIPAELEVSRAETKVDYGRVRIGDEDFLLPIESELLMAQPDVVSRNWVRFASCRRYSGESTLSFDDPVFTNASTAVPPTEVEIPADLDLQLEMPELDLMQAAVGDPVKAALRSELRSRRELIAPKGAIVRGRIVQLDRERNYFVLKIEFQDLDWPGGHARLNLVFDRTAFPTRLVTQGANHEILISRQGGPHFSAILMFWRTE